MFGTIPPRKLSNRIRVDCARLCFLPAVAWHLWCESWCWIPLFDVMLPFKEDTLHKLITTVSRWEKCMVFNMSGCWALFYLPGVYIFGCAAKYHVPAHLNLKLLLQDAFLGFAVTWMNSDFPVWFQTATVKGWSSGRRHGPIFLINDWMNFGWMTFSMCFSQHLCRMKWHVNLKKS